MLFELTVLAENVTTPRLLMSCAVTAVFCASRNSPFLVRGVLLDVAPLAAGPGHELLRHLGDPAVGVERVDDAGLDVLLDGLLTGGGVGRGRGPDHEGLAGAAGRHVALLALLGLGRLDLGTPRGRRGQTAGTGRPRSCGRAWRPRAPRAASRSSRGGSSPAHGSPARAASRERSRSPDDRLPRPRPSPASRCTSSTRRPAGS